MSGSDENVGEFSACPHCARTFNPSALERHIVICLKTSKKRKVFDSSMQRRIEEATNYVSVHRSDQHINKKSLEVAGEAKTKLVDYSKVPSRIANANTATTKRDAIKRDAIKRDAIKRDAIKKSTTSTTTTIGKLAPKFANKMVQTSRTSSMETLTIDGSARAVAAKRKASPKVAPQKSNHIERAKHASSVEPSSSHRIVAQRQSLQTCIHCKRSFNERAYAGHVAWCRDRYLGNPFSQYGTNVSSEAKQRLHLRTKYKPPVPKNRSPRN